MRIVHPAHTQPDVSTGAAGWLEIKRGATRFPRRPLLGTRFLIGSGSNCHLQLGGAFPMLHSLLIADADGWSIEAISPEPELIVNGVGCRRQQLDDGDQLQVGPFRFRFSLAGSSPRLNSNGSDPRITAGS